MQTMKPSGSDLDVPGSELDDELEDIGVEDDENYYYSIGGDKDLDEENDDVVDFEDVEDED